jgi:DNA-binding transcriptional LysR family regulator
MRVTMSQLEAVLWSVRLGSLRAAASRLNVTQPAITARFRELERIVGGTICQRSEGRLQLTPLGRELLAYAERFESLHADMVRSLAPARLFVGPVRLGVTDSFALTCLPALMGVIEAADSAARIDLEVDFSAVLAAKLAAGDLDIAVLTTPPSSPQATVLPLVELQLAWVASPKLGLGGGVHGPADLVDQPILTNPRPSNLFDSITGWFAPLGRQPERLQTCNSLTIMARLAMAGVGVTLLPVAILHDELTDGSLVALQTSPAIAAHPLAVAFRHDYAGRGLQFLADEIAALVSASELTP